MCSNVWDWNSRALPFPSRTVRRRVSFPHFEKERTKTILYGEESKLETYKDLMENEASESPSILSHRERERLNYFFCKGRRHQQGRKKMISREAGTDRCILSTMYLSFVGKEYKWWRYFFRFLFSFPFFYCALKCKPQFYMYCVPSSGLGPRSCGGSDEHSSGSERYRRITLSPSSFSILQKFRIASEARVETGDQKGGSKGYFGSWEKLL